MGNYQLIFLADVPGDGRSCDIKALEVIELEAHSDEEAKNEAAAWLRSSKAYRYLPYLNCPIRLVKTIEILN